MAMGLCGCSTPNMDIDKDFNWQLLVYVDAAKTLMPTRMALQTAMAFAWVSKVIWGRISHEREWPAHGLLYSAGHYKFIQRLSRQTCGSW